MDQLIEKLRELAERGFGDTNTIGGILRDAERDGVTVYWGAIPSDILGMTLEELEPWTWTDAPPPSGAVRTPA